MKNVFCTAIVAVAAMCVSMSAQAQVSAEYDPATGALSVVLPPNIGVIGFASPGNFLTDAMVEGIAGAAPSQRDADSLAWFNATGLPAGAYPLGRVLKTGLDGPTQVVYEFSVIGGQGGTGNATNKSVVIPEPAAIGLFGLAACVAGLRRRR